MASPHFTSIKKIDARRLTFEFHDVDSAVANSLRRAVADVPSAAFDQRDVKVVKNTGVLHNEFITHRVSLLPIYLDADEIARFDPSKYKFKLLVKNTDDENVDVTTADFEILDERGLKYQPDFHRRVFPADEITGDRPLITVLKPSPTDPQNGEMLQIECRATLGTASQHARWAVASLCTFSNVVDPQRAEAAFEEMAKGKKGDERAAMRRQFDMLDIQRHFHINQFGEPDRFGFRVESECALSPEYIVFSSFVSLLDALWHVRASVERGTAEVEQSQVALGSFFMIKIKECDHTIGNLVQRLAYNSFVRDSSSDIEYIGYYQPHPLEKSVVFKMRTREDAGPYDVPRVRALFGGIIASVHATIKALAIEWASVTGLSSDDGGKRSVPLRVRQLLDDETPAAFEEDEEEDDATTTEDRMEAIAEEPDVDDED
jgi:DNA-directed RNA polymerase subunit L